MRKFENLKIKQKIFMAIIPFMVMVAGCNVNKLNEEDFMTNRESEEHFYVPKENLPEWVIVRINDYYETRRKVSIYKGDWNKQTVYFIMDIFSSCLCDFFNENGERLVNNPSINIHLTSENWIIVYKYGDFVIDLNELFSN